MKKKYVLIAACCLFFISCGGANEKTGKGSTPVKIAKNPLLTTFNTPFGVPPFEKINDDDYLPAFMVALKEHNKEVEGVFSNTKEPTFKNTIARLDYSGQLLSKVQNVFDAKKEADTNDKIIEIAKEIAPQISSHWDGILMNAKLFVRVKYVYENRAQFSLNPEQIRLLDETYKNFVRGGANLDEKNKARLTQINKKLAVLGLEFGNNLLKENNEFKLVIKKQEELAGLPQSSIDSAANAAKDAGLDGKWVFTLHKPSWIPFLQFSQQAGYREKMFKGYINRGNSGDKNDNKKILVEMSRLRIERANLLGYKTHAHYVLDNNMAKTPDKVFKLLDKLWNAALPVTKAEASALLTMKKNAGKGNKLEPWDWWYYTEKLRKEKYDLSDEELKPYFKLENVQKGVFGVAAKLYGLQFVQRDDLPVYHKDVKVFEVKEADGKHVGIIYIDYFTRKSKSQGAWMTSYRKQKKIDGKMITPVIVNVLNFSKPTGDKPVLLSLEEVQTLFHEFGHGLHGLLSDVTYPGLAGTSVARDFVELPSQFMENWAMEPSVMKTYAKHYKTNEPIPDVLIEKITQSQHFNQGFMTTEYLAASFLDLNWHAVEKIESDVDVNKFEDDALRELGLIPQIVSRYTSTFFAHIFAGGYSSGYYGYIWAAVLDADAFAAFKEKDELFDKDTAKAFRENILSKGNTADPMELYVKFRGTKPSIDPLLERRGLK